MSKKKIYLLGILSGILMALSYPPMPSFLFAFIAFVPLLTAIENSKKMPYLAIYITFVIYCAGANWWIGSWQKDTDSFLYLAGVVLAFGHPLLFLIPFVIYNYIRKCLSRDHAIWIFPFIWVSFEWVKSFGDLAYTWLTFGHTQIYNTYWVQCADIAGVWGLSFTLLFFNILVFRILLKVIENREEKIPFFKIQSMKKYVAWLVLILVVPNVYGLFRMSQFDHDELLKENRSVKIGLIQPNINPWLKWEHDAWSQMDLHFRIQDSLINAVGPLDLTIWSETAITNVNYRVNFGHDYSLLSNRLKGNTALLTGIVDFMLYKDNTDLPATAKIYNKEKGTYYTSFNAALMLQNRPDSAESRQLYHKIKLTAFSEKTPFIDYLPFIKGIFEWGVGISSWTTGSEQKNLELFEKGDTLEIAPIICIESIYPYYVRNFVTNGADILVIITNDGWFDHTPGPEQHFLIAAMRAIENRRYLARTANTGVTGFIKPTGEKLLTAPQYQQIGIAASIPVMDNISPYYFFGDFLPILSVVLLVIILIYILFDKKKLIL